MHAPKLGPPRPGKSVSLGGAVDLFSTSPPPLGVSGRGGVRTGGGLSSPAMTPGTVHSYHPARGTGRLRCVAGTLVPFTSHDPALAVGDAVAFRLVGGITGLYALDVVREGVAAPPSHQTATSSSGFRLKSGTLAPSAG